MNNALQFLPTPPDAGLIYTGSYNQLWVIVSVLLAILASYAALNASTRIERQHDTVAKLIWVAISALTLGVGIWAMHFIGMLALSLPCGVYYDPVITLISIIPGILASGVALGVVWHHGTKRLPPLIGSILLGAGIGTMHYTGMAAMQLEGVVRYNPALFVLSIIVAVALSYLALRVKNGVARLNQQQNMLVAVIMGGAVSGMHFTAMSAAYFVRGDVAAPPSSLFSPDTIAIIIALTTVFLTVAALALAAISRNREITAQLRDSEERWKFALEGSGDGVWDWNPKTDEVLFSSAWKEMAGYAEHEFPDTGTAWVEHLHPDDRERVLSARREYLAGRQPTFVVEFRMRCKDGSWKWILTRGKLVSRDADGNPLRMIGTHTDISDRKLMEMALSKSHQQLYSLLNSMAEGAYGVDTNGYCTFVNRSFLRLLGYKNADEIIGKHIHELIHHSHPDGRHYPASECRMYAAYRSNQEIHAANEVFWRKNGMAIPVEYWSQPIITDGVMVGAVATFIDITERKQAEAELRVAATAFESQEGILITDANSMILRVNQAFTNITGYTTEETIGKNPRILRSGHQSAEFYAAMWEKINNTGAWAGEIWNRRKDGEVYPEHLTITAVKDQNGIVTNYVAALTDVTKSKEAANEIQRLAFYDPLTGLPNRRLLQDRLKTALASSHRNGLKGALLFIDMDNFKILNDTLGHDMGDLLLQQVAQRLESCVREGDTVARLGGDEFVVMLEDLSEHAFEAAAQTEIIGEKILDILNRPYQLATYAYISTPSIGAALFKGHELATDELLKQADIAMYQAKASGRNALRFFDPQMQASITARVALEEDLRLALAENQFKLYYQLQANHDSKAVGAEALIRWQHPQRGMILPANFIPLAEETGLILPIGQWVLETACAQIKLWEGGAHTRHLQLAVNISARQFRQADFVEQVSRILHRSAINPDKLKMELTESLLLDDIDKTVIKMQALRKIGVRFSMDDFGTGYSSLFRLKKLPIDQLKIDQRFVRDIAINLDGAVLVRTIILMANNLGMEVIAEGVETEAQRAFLEQNDCLICQGYLFSKPLPLAEFEQLLKRSL